jgi:hypothetical protein
MRTGSRVAGVFFLGSIQLPFFFGRGKRRGGSIVLTVAPRIERPKAIFLSIIRHLDYK